MIHHLETGENVAYFCTKCDAPVEGKKNLNSDKVCEHCGGKL